MKKFKTLVVFTDAVPSNEDFQLIDERNDVTCIKVCHGIYVTQATLSETAQAIHGTLQLSFYEAIVSSLSPDMQTFYSKSYFN